MIASATAASKRRGSLSRYAEDQDGVVEGVEGQARKQGANAFRCFAVNVRKWAMAYTNQLQP
jgi:hypothetical protein